MVCVSAGFGDDATTCAELCRELSVFSLKNSEEETMQEEETFTKTTWALGRTGELQEFNFPSCCHTSDMQNKRHVCEDRMKAEEEDRMTDDFSEPQTRFDMFEVLHVL